MKRGIALLFIMFAGTIIALNAQIYIDNQGNIHDQRKNKTTVNKSTQKQAKPSSGSKFDPSKLTYGGNFGFQGGNYTSVNISPQVGYNFSKHFTAGLGVGYTYYRDKYWSGGEQYRLTNNYVGMNCFMRAYPIDFLVLSVQPEGNRMWKTIKLHGEEVHSDDKFIGSVIIGGGFRYRGMLAMIQYDVVQDDDSPYGNKIFYSVGFSF